MGLDAYQATSNLRVLPTTLVFALVSLFEASRPSLCQVPSGGAKHRLSSLGTYCAGARSHSNLPGLSGELTVLQNWIRQLPNHIFFNKATDTKKQ